jgi:hypothetical protein
MPGLTHHRGLAVSLVQDQDINLVDIDAADLTITVIGAADEGGAKHVTDINVSNQVCRESRYLQPIIDTSTDPTEITLGGDPKHTATNKHGQDEGENRDGLLVVLAHLHGLSEQRMEELGLYKISVLGIWYAIAYSERDEYGSAAKTLKPWFAKWYATSIERVDLTIDSARGLALPCQLFNHAAAFARVTKWLTYNHVGHVKERPPKGFKGSKGLYIPPGEFVGKSCSFHLNDAPLTCTRSSQPRPWRPQDDSPQEPLQEMRPPPPLRHRSLQLLGLHRRPLLPRAHQDRRLPR